jgi:hypothetical protein
MATRECILCRSCEHFIEHVQGANTLDDMARTWEGGADDIWAGRAEASAMLHCTPRACSMSGAMVGGCGNERRARGANQE